MKVSGFVYCEPCSRSPVKRKCESCRVNRRITHELQGRLEMAYVKIDKLVRLLQAQAQAHEAEQRTDQSGLRSSGRFES